MSQTRSIISAHLPSVIVAIIDGYIYPTDISNEFDIAKVGHGELCLKIQDFNQGLSGACRGGHIEIVRLMITMGANNWDSGLLSACHSGHHELVELMISHGARSWDVGLYMACEGGHLEIVKIMIANGARLFNWGLEGACKGGHYDIVKLMISLGAKNNWELALELACCHGYRDIVKLLITHGATEFNWGLFGACEGKNYELAELMISYGATRCLCNSDRHNCILTAMTTVQSKECD